MDFMNRGGQARNNNATTSTNSANTPSPAAASSAASTNQNTSNSGGHNSKWTRLGFMLLLFSGTILIVATLFFLAFGKGSYRESQFVNEKQLQAVFINVNGTNGGQVYFGNIKDMTSNYIHLTNVFYIQNQQAGAEATSSSYNLVKLGCELHGPENSMFINRSEVFFWENLKADSQVAQKVAEFHKQNPQGQKCSAGSQTQQQPAAATQVPGTSQTPAATTAPTTNTTTNTPGNGGGDTTTTTPKPPVPTTGR